MRPLGSRYVLESVIGRGGFGQVWRGRDVDGQPLAFKLLHEHYGADEDVMRRFVQERSILTSLDHPNLVRVRDMVMEGDTLALVMDLVDGVDLKSRLQAAPPLDEVTRMSLASGVASGLQAAHAAGVVHRDIKPENVLIETATDGDVRAKLVDFGVSRIAGSGTSATTLAGTLTYMAPELFDEQPPSPESDLYALGVLLHELMAGAPPFRSDSFASLMRMHTVVQPTRPDGLADDVWSLIERLLRKSPTERPGSAGAVAFALGELAARRQFPTDQTIARPLVVPPLATEINDVTILRADKRRAVPPPPPPPPPPLPASPGSRGGARSVPPWLLWILGGTIAMVVVGALAFALGRLSGDDSAPPVIDAAGEVTAASDLLTCWDGSQVESGVPCPEVGADPERALFWAFGIDQGSVGCTLTDVHGHAATGYVCDVDGHEVRLAIWDSVSARDERLHAYGPGRDIGDGLIRHTPGSGDRHLVRYDSDTVLMYASAWAADGAGLDRLSLKSLDELRSGVGHE